MRVRLAGLLVTAMSGVLICLAGCAQSLSGTPDVTIAASAGTFSGAGTAYSFDAGTVPQYTTETVTFTVTNSGSASFEATGSAIFTNSDFSTDIGSSITVPAGSSATFHGYFTPTNSSGTETGTLTLTPSLGNPVAIDLTGSADQGFQFFSNNAGLVRITNTSYQSSTPFSLTGCEFFKVQTTGSSIVTLTNVALTGAAAADVYLSTYPSGAVTTTPQSFDMSSSGLGTGEAGLVFTGTDSTTGATFSFTFYVAATGTGGC